MDETKPRTILIVDDDSFLLNMYDMKFKKGGFTVVTCQNGPDALKKLRDGLNPDIITLDMVMPDMDGLEFLRELKKGGLAKEAALIVLSNQSQSADVEKAKELGIDGYIVKATTIPSELVEEVEKVLAKRKK